MTIKQAQYHLDRPLIFGDELQIAALQVLERNNTIAEAIEPFWYDQVLDYIGEDIVREWLDNRQPLPAIKNPLL